VPAHQTLLISSPTVVLFTSMVFGLHFRRRKMFWWTQYTYSFRDNSFKPCYSAKKRFKKFEECREDYQDFKIRMRDVPDMPMVTLYHVETDDYAKAFQDVHAMAGRLFYWRIFKRKWTSDFFGTCNTDPSFYNECVSEQGFQSLKACLRNSLRFHHWKHGPLGFSFIEAVVR